MLVTVVALGTSCLNRVSESINSYRDRGGPHRDPHNRRHFGALIFCRASKVQTVTGIGVALVLYRSSIEP